MSRGDDMLALVRRLYPICRSITGDGVRETLGIIGEQLPLQTSEVLTGTPVLDWTIPDEWNLRRATLRGPDGEILADTNVHNLHVVNYSEPITAKLSLDELRPHLHSLPNQPDLIPYRTSYYKRTWGFCLPHSVVESLREGTYQVQIDTTLQPGSLTYAELFIPGATEEEFVFSAHVCHPSLANDNLAGIAVATGLAKRIRAKPQQRLSYRFIFAPGTIGAIAWLALNRAKTKHIRHGLILSCLGDPGSMTYKRSRHDDSEINRLCEYVLASTGRPFTVNDFIPYGYDERQYGSPGFDLPFGALMRTPNGQYPEYHTSADNPDLLRAEALEDSLNVLEQIVEAAEANQTYVNKQPYGEPQLGRRGLYNLTGGATKPAGYDMALLWVLNFSDGKHDLLAIAKKSKLPLMTLTTAAEALKRVDLL